MNHALVRLIASDLDGTFLRDDRTVSGRTTGAVRAAVPAFPDTTPRFERVTPGGAQ